MKMRSDSAMSADTFLPKVNIIIVWKMSLIFLSNLQSDLKFLSDQPVQVLTDFCQLAWDFIFKGTNPKLYQIASSKLQVDIKQVESGVESLAFLFVEAGKNNLNEESFKQAVTSLNLQEDLLSVIFNEYSSQKNELNSLLPELAIQHLKFKDLQWRMEVQVGSRCIKSKNQINIILKLELEEGSKSKGICIQSDIPNLIHMNWLVNQALQDSRTHHSKRIQRAIA